MNSNGEVRESIPVKDHHWPHIKGGSGSGLLIGRLHALRPSGIGNELLPLCLQAICPSAIHGFILGIVIVTLAVSLYFALYFLTLS